jgi:2-oxo-4-hydroxy-4-carboxy--5-ureidoimidazoline (OHCU) decarboxylase
MHRGYVLTNLEMDSVVSVNSKNKNFDLLPINSTAVLNKSLCFVNRTAAKTVQEKIVEKFPDFPATKVVNVAQLYNKVF